MFFRADQNQDGYLNGTELAKWINDRVKAHLIFALKDNFNKYFKIDTNPRNGKYNWKFVFKVLRFKCFGFNFVSFSSQTDFKDAQF